MSKTAAVPPTLSTPSSRADLERKRGGVIAEGPSGAVYRIRKLNLQRHAFAGGLPAELKQAAMSAMSRGGSPVQAAGRAIAQIDPERLEAAMDEMRSYNDELVVKTIIEPALTVDDLGGGLEDDPLLPSVDYEWLLGVAQSEIITDGQGRWLWGPRPKSDMEIWISEHDCPDDCEHCMSAVEILTAPIAQGSREG